MLFWFVAGIVVGWLIELVIDWNFWRRAIYSSAPADVTAINELAMMRRKVKEYEARIQELQAQIDPTVTSEPLSTDSSSITE